MGGVAMWVTIGAAAWGQTLVCPDISCTHATIAEALLAAPTDGTLAHYLVLEGTYVEDGLDVITGQHVLFEAIGAVTVRAATDGSTFTVREGAILELDGFTLSAQNGRGVRVIDGRLELRNGVVFPLGVVGSGAGILATGGSVDISDSLFLDSVAASDGGHLSVADGDLTVARTQFLGGTAVEGGSVFLSAASPHVATFTDTQFEGNLATARGGAVMVQGAVDLSLVDVSFEDNFAREGGALAVADTPTTTVTLEGTELLANEASEHGGALAIFGSSVHAIRTEWIGNVAGDQGGAIYVEGSGTLQLEGSLLCDNQGRRGGAIRSISDPTQVWSNNRMLENQATEGGGAIDLGGGEVEVIHHNLLGNSAPIGSAIRASSHPTLRNNLIAFHPQGIAIELGTGGFDEGHSATWANAAGNVTDGVEFGAFHQQTDPLLRDYVVGRGCDQVDFHSWYGPLTNTGDPNGAADRDGSRADIGAYGGPGASDAAWDEDLDGDGFPPLYDCVEGDPAYYPDPSPDDGETHDTPYDGLDQDCDGGDDFDVDGDGFHWPEDCDDTDALIFPGAPEPVGSGDRNCDLLIDADGDGVEPPEDCDDSNPRIHPGVVEDADPTVDLDCDGTGDVVRPVVPLTCSAVGGTPSHPVGTLVGLAFVALLRRRAFVEGPERRSPHGLVRGTLRSAGTAAKTVDR